MNSREIWIIPDLNPDGGEWDIRNGSYSGLAQEPAAELRQLERRHRPQPQLALPVGLLWRLVRHHLQ